MIIVIYLQTVAVASGARCRGWTEWAAVDRVLGVAADARDAVPVLDALLEVTAPDGERRATRVELTPAQARTIADDLASTADQVESGDD